VDRRLRDAGLDQDDAPAVDDRVIGRRRDRHGPAQMISDPNAQPSG